MAVRMDRQMAGSLCISGGGGLLFSVETGSGLVVCQGSQLPEAVVTTPEHMSVLRCLSLCQGFLGKAANRFKLNCCSIGARSIRSFRFLLGGPGC